MYRSDDDLALLAELAGVLDQTVTEHGLSSGTYLVLRQLVRAEGATAITAMAEHLSADSQEVADMAGRLAADGLAEVPGGGLRVTDAGRDTGRGGRGERQPSHARLRRRAPAHRDRLRACGLDAKRTVHRRGSARIPRRRSDGRARVTAALGARTIAPILVVVVLVGLIVVLSLRKRRNP